MKIDRRKSPVNHGALIAPLCDVIHPEKIDNVSASDLVTLIGTLRSITAAMSEELTKRGLNDEGKPFAVERSA